MKTILPVILTLVSTSGLSHAFESDPLHTFANCAGRLSAVMEFQWMFDGEGSEITAERREAMLSLINATMGEGDGPKVLSWRIAAKQAHAVLLTRATFNDDANDAAWANTMAKRLEEECTSFLLG